MTETWTHDGNAILLTALWTQDGIVIVFDSEIGTVSAHSEHAAWIEIARRKEHKRQMDARR